MKKEVAEQIAEQFIAALEQGTVPWRKPWSGSGLYPKNYYSNRAYRGVNVLILGMTSQAMGYESPCWTTYKAAAERGAFVRKGEKSTKIIYWSPLTVTDKETGEEKSVFMSRLYSVFNTDQIDGIDWQPPERGEPISVPNVLEQMIAEYPNPPEFRWMESDRAFYAPHHDRITLPRIEQFDTVEGYAETLLHEMTHSTGHEKRLHRFNSTSFSHGDYAKEELVAEIGAAMLMQEAGITVGVTENHAAYVQSWLKALQDDHSLIIKAAQHAQKAVDLIRNVQSAAKAEAA